MKRYLFYVEYDYCYPILRPVQEVIRARGGEVAWLPVGPHFNRHFLRPDEQVFEHVREAIAWNPFAVLVPGNEVPDFIPGWKVTPFHGLISSKRRRDGRIYHFIIRGMFDLYCTHGPNTTERFQELAREHGDFRVAETGWPKFDPLQQGRYERVVEECPVILFTATFTPRFSAAPHLLETLQQLAEKGRWKWLVNLHPKMPTEIVDAYRAARSEHFQLVETDDTTSLLAQADVMLCDSSSILNEFLVCRKPVVTFRTLDPAPHLLDVRELAEIEPAIERALERPSELMERIHAWADETNPYHDGRSGERVLDAIDELAESGFRGLRRRPRNVYRTFKMRRLLDYWGR